MAADLAGKAAKTAKKQRGRPFPKGTSGNPGGRPAGSRNAATLALEALIDGQGKAIVGAMVEAALNGDTSAGRALLDRLVPPRKERPVRFTLPALETTADAPRALAAIAAGVAAGDLTAGEAADLSALVERFIRAVESTDLEARICQLEKDRDVNAEASR